jgi:hypothetical protein
MSWPLGRSKTKFARQRVARSAFVRLCGYLHATREMPRKTFRSLSTPPRRRILACVFGFFRSPTTTALLEMCSSSSAWIAAPSRSCCCWKSRRMRSLPKTPPWTGACDDCYCVCTQCDTKDTTNTAPRHRRRHQTRVSSVGVRPRCRVQVGALCGATMPAHQPRPRRRHAALAA